MVNGMRRERKSSREIMETRSRSSAAVLLIIVLSRGTGIAALIDTVFDRRATVLFPFGVSVRETIDWEGIAAFRPLTKKLNARVADEQSETTVTIFLEDRNLVIRTREVEDFDFKSFHLLAW